jgi:hypothetical protein
VQSKKQPICTASVSLTRKEGDLLMERGVIWYHRGLLNVFDYIPEWEVGLGLAWSLHRNVGLRLSERLGRERRL